MKLHQITIWSEGVVEPSTTEHEFTVKRISTTYAPDKLHIMERIIIQHPLEGWECKTPDELVIQDIDINGSYKDGLTTLCKWSYIKVIKCYTINETIKIKRTFFDKIFNIPAERIKVDCYFLIRYGTKEEDHLPNLAIVDEEAILNLKKKVEARDRNAAFIKKLIE